MSRFKTVAGETEVVSVIERSKFICLIKGVDGEEDAKSFIDVARKKYPLATHYCYAYIADEKGLNQKFSDDGEPHGTAGLPILNAIKGRGLCKTVAVVVRYFGGIKLGTGGLSRAYGGVAAGAIDKADVKTLTEAEFFTLTLSYAQYKKISPFIAGLAISTEYDKDVQVKIATEKGCDGIFNKLSEILGVEIPATKDGEGFFGFKEKQR